MALSQAYWGRRCESAPQQAAKKAEARHRTALKSGRRKARVAKPPSGAIEKPEIARLTRQLSDARDQQLAMSEVLQAISRSKFELSAVLESVAEAAARLCRSDGAVIFQLDGGVYRFAAGYSLLPAYLEIERRADDLLSRAAAQPASRKCREHALQIALELVDVRNATVRRRLRSRA